VTGKPSRGGVWSVSGAGDRPTDRSAADPLIEGPLVARFRFCSVLGSRVVLLRNPQAAYARSVRPPIPMQRELLQPFFVLFKF